MTCQACTAAEANPLTGRYSADCTECKARALAQGRELFESLNQRKQTPEYQAALTKVFGEGNEADGHERVRQWSRKVRATQKGRTK